MTPSVLVLAPQHLPSASVERGRGWGTRRIGDSTSSPSPTPPHKGEGMSSPPAAPHEPDPKMTPELTALTLAGLLQCLQFGLVSVTANLELGPAKTLSPRDPARLGKPLMEQLSPRSGRLFRAMNNHFEGLILFTLAVVVVTLSNQSTPITAACAFAYLAARILYVPAYWLGLVPWRSLIWGVGFLATLIMLVAALI